VDVYALAIVDGDDVDLIGYIESEKAIKQENIRDLGHGEGYVIDQEVLIKFKTKAAT
jgi:hypothetical protein